MSHNHNGLHTFYLFIFICFFRLFVFYYLKPIVHRQIDETSKRHGRSPTDILLEEWGTSGRTRATVDDLLELLKRVQLYHAANFVAIQILKIRPKEMFEQFHSNVSESNKLFDWTHITLPSEFDSYSNFAYELQTLSKDYERVRKNDENNHGIKQTMNSIISNDGIVPTLSILNGFIYDII